MAKNSNVKSGSFLKSEEVVLIEDNVKGNTSKGPAVPVSRRSMSLRASPSVVAKQGVGRGSGPPEAKYANIQPKLPLHSKQVALIQVACKTPSIPISVTVAPRPLTPAAKQECHVTTPIRLPPLPNSLPVVRRKQALARGTQPIVKKPPLVRNVPIMSEKTGKYIPSPKQEDARNGQLVNQSPIARRPIPPGLTITPIVDTSTPKPNNTVKQMIIKCVQLPDSSVMCGKCNKPSATRDACDSCGQSFLAVAKYPSASILEVKDNEQLAQIVTPKLPVFTKEAFYGTKLPESSNISIRKEPCLRDSGIRVVVMPNSQPNPPPNPRGRPKGSKNKIAEPVCLTLSSDEEEGGHLGEMQVCSTPRIQLQHNTPTLRRKLPVRASLDRVAKEVQINDVYFRNVKQQQLQQQTKVKSVIVEGGEEDEDLDDEEMAEEEEVEEEEEEDEELDGHGEEMNSSGQLLKQNLLGKVPRDKHMIPCRSIRIGSYKIHPVDDIPHLPVYADADGFSFAVLTLNNCFEATTINLRSADITQALGHFGRCLPIMFISVTPACGERIRKQLHMVKGDPRYFDPEEPDEKQKIITFLIDTITDDLRSYLRHMFSGDGILKEVDQKIANEILVKSTPAQSPATKCATQNAVQIAQFQNPLQSPLIIQPVPVKVITPVTKLMTYPPPPQTGGIAITSEDLSCLDEGEFLNDAIIDFYLKYLMNEKLSEADRQRTHIFSSFFYPRLTNKVTVRGKNEEGCVAQKRHSQVKTWTKNVDIFEKDFIIIPINQNVHWFLAIICFPGLVPFVQTNTSPGQKSIESVTSTIDQESCESTGVLSGDLINDVSQLRPSVKDQACNTDESISDENSDLNSMVSNEAESNYFEEPIPEAPDSSTHPDRRHEPHKKMPCILIFDSLCGPNRWRIVNMLREYLDVEWRLKKGTARDFSKFTMQGHVPHVPQQTNYSDCGIYLLQYVESFFEDPFPYFASPMPELPDWFPDEKVLSKRGEIKTLISDLQKRNPPCSTPTTPNTGNVNTRASARLNAENMATLAASSTSLPNMQMSSS